MTGPIADRGDLAPRPWVLDRVQSWLEEEGAKPLMLVRGDPGSGKSSVLLQLAEDTPEVPIIGFVSRAIGRSDRFDGPALLGTVIENMKDLGVQLEETEDGTQLPTHLSVHIEASGNEAPTNILGAALLSSSAQGRLAIAEKLIGAVPPERRMVLVVDALDQAEDEERYEFLTIVASLVRAARGSGVRFVTASRRALPISFQESLTESFDLIADAPPEADDLRRYLETRFQGIPEEDRQRAVTAIIDGAESNWLWATTNAESLEAEIAQTNGLPNPIRLTKGLEGLYVDGIGVIRRCAGKSWEKTVRPILNAVAAATSEELAIIELRWVTGQDDAEIEDVARLCEPFLRQREKALMTFHPDFSRWLLNGEVPGISAGAGHLALARGFTRFGRETQWAPVARNAANKVLDHWWSVLVFDPFSPSASDYQEEIESILHDRDWALRSRVELDDIDQIALVSPTLRFPNSNLPLAAGLEALKNSPSAHGIVGQELIANIPDEQLKLFDDIRLNPMRALRWMDAEIPDYSVLAAQTVWPMVLDEEFLLGRSEGHLTFFLAPAAILKRLDDLTLSAAASIGTLLNEVARDQYDFLLDELRERAAALPEGAANRGGVHLLLGDSLNVKANLEADEAKREELIQEALEAFAIALEEAEGEEALLPAAEWVNTLNRRKQLTREDYDELIPIQARLVELRREQGDPTWVKSCASLAGAYRRRFNAIRSEDEDAPRDDLREAARIYREALAGAASGLERPSILTSLANTLLALAPPDDQELEELIEVQSEVLAFWHRSGGPGEPQAALVLAEAFGLRASRREDDERAEAQDDRRRSLSRYWEALAGIPAEDKRRMAVLGGLAHTLVMLDEKSDQELDDFIVVHEELLSRLLADDHPREYCAATAMLVGEAHFERAMKAEPSEATEDLRQSVDHYRQALEWTPEDDENRESRLATMANSLAALAERNTAEREQLIEVDEELIPKAREKQDPIWLSASIQLAQGLRVRAEDGDDSESSRTDLERALEVITEAEREIDPDGGELHRTCMMEIANILLQLPELDRDQADELVRAQSAYVEILRKEGHSNPMRSVILLGKAHRLRAEHREDPEQRADELRASLAVLREALVELPEESTDRLSGAMEFSAAMAELPERTKADLDEWIPVQAEVLARLRQLRHSGWPKAAALLGTAHRQRALMSASDEDRQDDLEHALAGFRAALVATPEGVGIRLSFQEDLARTLIYLDERDEDRQNELIYLLSDLRDELEADDSEGKSRIGSWLSAAYRERFRQQEHREPQQAQADLQRALEVGREAVAAAGEGSNRIATLIELSNALLSIDHPSETELEEIIDVQSELLTRRRDKGEERWIDAAGTLGEVYLMRARQREEGPERIEDLELAMAHSREALVAAPPDYKKRLLFAVTLANTMVVHGAVTGAGNRQLLDDAVEIVLKEGDVSGRRPELLKLFPFLRAALSSSEPVALAGARAGS